MRSSKDYLLADFPRVLFPLNTTAVLVGHCNDNILTYIYEHVLNDDEKEHAFLPQTPCYSGKLGLHLRRTVKLDPVAELFIYDLIYRNRTHFRPDHRRTRRSFGYGFRDGLPRPVTEGYAEFRSQVLGNQLVYAYAAAFDIANYFNTLYHHDLVQWFNTDGRSLDDANALGQFLREINAGRSQDCLPQGIHPCKMIGAEFLKFVDNSFRLRSNLMLRLMDDFFLFANDEQLVISDFLEAQEMLGSKGLSVNPSKTQLGNVGDLGIAHEVDEIKASLLKARRHVVSLYGSEEGEADEEYEDLSEEQVAYLLNLLRDPDIDESDVELVLVLLRDHGQDEMMEQLEGFLARFPSLARNVYNFAAHVADAAELAGLLLRFLRSTHRATEYQLFWIGKIVEEYLRDGAAYPDLVHALLEHPNATQITTAKVLEIPDDRFGLPDLRADRLRTGESNWTSGPRQWGAATRLGLHETKSCGISVALAL